MPWDLYIQRGGGGPTIETRTELDPHGVLGGFTWRTAKSGDCVSCEFDALVPQLGLRNRDLISLWVNATPVFFGPVVELPHPRDPRRGAVSAVGARELLSRRVIRNDVFVNQDVGTIARTLVLRYAHPALIYDPDLIPNTGRVLSEFRMPWRTLEQALDTLSKSVGDAQPLPFGVRADGRVFFGRFSAETVDLSMADLTDLQWLRVSGDEVVTRSYMVALSRLSGTPPGTIQHYPLGYQEVEGQAPPDDLGVKQFGAAYTPATYVLQTDDLDWNDLDLEAANLVPDGADVIAAPGGVLPERADGLVDAANFRDGDPATFAANDGAASNHDVLYNLPEGVSANPVIGCRLVYSLDKGALAGRIGDSVSLYYSYPNPAGPTPIPGGGSFVELATLNFRFPIADTRGERREIVAVCPISEEMLRGVMNGPFTTGTHRPYQAFVQATVGVGAESPLPAGSYKIYSFEPLFLDLQKVDTLARKFLHPPAQAPTELTVPGLLPPMFSVTVQDAPGGPVVGDVAEIEGQLLPDGGMKTVIKLEQPDASVEARMLRLVARDRAQDAQTQLRGFLER